jgi:hypothetical protein
MRGVHMKTVTLVHLRYELLHKFVVERQSAPAFRALKVVVIRLADPLEYRIAGA